MTSLPSPEVAVDLSILTLIGQADLVVKIVLIILFCASIWSWAIIFDKYTLIKRLEARAEQFEQIFWSGQLLEQIYARLKTTANHPMEIIFLSGMEAWRRQDLQSISDSSGHLGVSIKDRLYQTMSITRNKEMDKISHNLNILATIGSNGTFLGLFGTVWGIMNNMQALSASKNVTLSVVAPGIAEALFATAVGLIAAIPAMMFYNLLSSRLNRFADRVDDFLQELSSIYSKEIDEVGKK